jgi:hypothetical protein
MSNELKIGLIGLDTSHVPAFTSLLNDATQEYHVPGGRVVAAFPGGSPDFDLSINRVEGFTQEIRDKYGVAILDSPEAVAEQSDAILITAVDGRAHLALFQAIAGTGKPVFIDKPFATSSADAKAIAQLAADNGVKLFSASSLRYAQPLVEALAQAEPLSGVDCSGPMDVQPTQTGLFWYGIHSVEMLYTALGQGCVQVSTVSNANYDLVTGVWADGRIGTVRGNRIHNNSFGALLHGQTQSTFVEAYKHPKPGYAGLLERIIPMFQGGEVPIDINETQEIIRFIEAANESRDNGGIVVKL